MTRTINVLGAALAMTLAVAGCQCADARLVTHCGAECGGCCDENGHCNAGNSEDACGLEAAACVACSGGSFCYDGRCVTTIPTDPVKPDASVDAGPTANDAGPVVPDAGASSCPPDGWCSENPLPDGGAVTRNHLRSVWAASPTEVWAVGDYGTVLHSDGTTWTQVSSGFGDDLFGVWGTGPADVWAVGGSGFPTGPVGLIAHFDGQSWTVMKRGMRRLEAVWGSGPGDVWAGGTDGELWHFDGTSWTPRLGVTTESIVDISGTSPSQAWAVGSSGLLLKWDAATWSTIPTQSRSGLTSVLAFSPSLAWAAGGNGAFLAWNGTTWTEFNIGQNYTVMSFWGEAASAWAVGPAGAVIYFDGVSPQLKTSGTTRLLRDIHGTDPAHIWAVGFEGTILRYRP